MWIGACTSTTGSWMQQIAQAWLVFDMSKSPFLLGLDGFLANIPIFLFSLIGGVIADRMDRRHLLLGSQFLQMFSAFLLTALYMMHWLQVWHILALSFVSGVAQAFGGPAYLALVPTLVPREILPNAIALNSIQFNLARVVGGALGGLALAQLGPEWCFGLNGLSFFAPIISLLMLSVRFVPAQTGESILTSMKQGFGFIRKQGAMEALIVLAFLMTALGIPLLTFLPVFAKDIFHEGPLTFTVFMVCSGAGSIVGALVVAGMGNMKHKGRIALLMLVCLGAGIAGFALSPFLVLSCALLFFCGGSIIAVFATITSLVQLITSDDMRGRVMSVYNVAFRGGMPMGQLVTGWLVPIFSAPSVIAVNGALLVLLAVYFLFGQRKVAAL